MRAVIYFSNIFFWLFTAANGSAKHCPLVCRKASIGELICYLSLGIFLREYFNRFLSSPFHMGVFRKSPFDINESDGIIICELINNYYVISLKLVSRLPGSGEHEISVYWSNIFHPAKHLKFFLHFIFRTKKSLPCTCSVTTCLALVLI